MVAGLVIGFIAAGFLVSMALWHLVREMHRIDEKINE